MSTAQARRQKKLQQPTRPIENVALTTKDLQETKTQLLNGTTVEKIDNENKLILTEIFPSMHETCYLKVFATFGKYSTRNTSKNPQLPPDELTKLLIRLYRKENDV